MPSVHSVQLQRVPVPKCLLPFRFDALVVCPDRRPTDEEALLRRETVNIGRTRLPFSGLQERLVRDDDTTEVGNGFAENQLAVQVQAVGSLITSELLAHTVGPRHELVSVFRRPPGAKVSLRIELASLVIKTMSYFMSDDGANGAVVESIISLRIKERGLQDPGGKDDFVVGRIVVSIDGGRRHHPFGLVDGFVDLGNIAFDFEHIALAIVGEVTVTGESQ